MYIDHVGLYVKDLEDIKDFFETYFNAKVSHQYHNHQTGLKTYFLVFDNHTRLEIMHRPELIDKTFDLLQVGFHHIAFKLGSKEKVNQMTFKLEKDGYIILNGPRTTGDGYYETLFKLENYVVELVA